MKKILLLILTIGTLFSVNAQSEKYMQAMNKFVAQLDTTQATADFQTLANQFELIAKKEQNQWLPYYYAAYCNVNLAYRGDKKMIDELCDKADVFLQKADSLQPNNAEIYVMKSKVTGARIMVNPMSRGQKFGKQSGEWLEKAKAIDATNPRIYFSEGAAKYYTPKMFGGGKEAAKPILEEAAKKYETFKPLSSIHPNWGKEQCASMLAECNKEK